MESTKLYVFLQTKGFLLVKNEVSDFFGNSYTVFSNGIIKLRFINEKFIRTIDIGSALGNKEVWYDLSLVKSMLYHDIQLNSVLTLEQYKKFLEMNIDRLNSIFDYDTYETTITQLETLQDKRAKQMFPWFKPSDNTSQ